MNVFFVFDDGSLQTPPLGGTILPGITRDSLLTLARSEGLTIREQPYSMDQWKKDAASGRLTEAFACGTAPVVTPIGRVASPEGERPPRPRETATSAPAATSAPRGSSREGTGAMCFCASTTCTRSARDRST